MEVAKYRLRDIVKFLNGRAYLMPELQDAGKYRILRVGNLSGGNDSWYYSDMELDEDKYCENGDLLYAWACNFGPHIWKEEKVIYHYHVWKLVEDKQRVDRKYLYYYLLYQTPFYLGGVNGATMVHITKQNMEKKIVFIPKSLDTQHRIASILSAYDNLIENNNRRIRLLEQMAENLYKEWFVRFRFPGYEKAEFENGLPKGWKKTALSDYADIIMGQSPESVYYNNQKDGLPFHQGVGSYGDFYLVDDIYATKGKKIAEPNSVIFSVRAPVGRINVTLNRIILGRGVSAMNAKDKTNSFLLWMLKEHFSNEDSIGNGSIFTSVTKEELFNHKIVLPNEEVRKKFDEIGHKIEREIRSLTKNSFNLAHQRDLLLPRLMSGKLDVEE